MATSRIKSQKIQAEFKENSEHERRCNQMFPSRKNCIEKNAKFVCVEVGGELGRAGWEKKK